MISKNVVPLNGNILIIDDDREERKVGGIILADTVEGKRMLNGTVLATSPFLLEDGSFMDPRNIKVGDRVIYSMHAAAGGVWTDDDDKRTYRLAKWTEILGVLNDKS